jgi:hypothetical protein
VFLHRINKPVAEVTEQAWVLVDAADCTVEGMRGLRQFDHDQLDAYWTRIGEFELGRRTQRSYG